MTSKAAASGLTPIQRNVFTGGLFSVGRAWPQWTDGAACAASLSVETNSAAVYFPRQVNW